jgi:hypothetical protein
VRTRPDASQRLACAGYEFVGWQRLHQKKALRLEPRYEVAVLDVDLAARHASRSRRDCGESGKPVVLTDTPWTIWRRPSMMRPILTKPVNRTEPPWS